MKTPHQTAAHALWVQANGPCAIPRLIPSASVVPAVTYDEMDESRQFVRNNCHNLRACRGDEGCAQLAERARTANNCVWHRFRVRAYYIERGQRVDPGDHEGALEHNDNVAQTCAVAYRQRCIG